MMGKNGANSKYEFEAEFQVLSMGTWPLQTYKNAVVIPKQLNDCQQEFEAFYKKKFNGRVLHWNIERGSTILSAKFDMNKNSFQLETSAIQALILLCFNTHE
jgi:hypothetical protein